MVANLPVFDAQGMSQINLSMQDTDAVSGEFNVNMYQVMATFSCLAPVRVGHRATPITDITSWSTNG
ncbi:hypothetical protein D3C79_1060010 [compost metagenome]